jgi:plasmid maintenance system antidote protein VapI
MSIGRLSSARPKAKRQRVSTGGRQAALLNEFIANERIKPRELARVAFISRQHLVRLRAGTADPTRHVMVRLAMACTLILHRRVQLHELFDLTDAGL